MDGHCALLQQLYRLPHYLHDVFRLQFIEYAVRAENDKVVVRLDIELFDLGLRDYDFVVATQLLVFSLDVSESTGY